MNDYYAAPPVPSLRSEDYRTETAWVEAGWYWRLFYQGERINGGLAESEAQARQIATERKFLHHHIEFRRTHTWDSETGEWYPNVLE